jgi:hypothetical protein
MRIVGLVRLGFVGLHGWPPPGIIHYAKASQIRYSSMSSSITSTTTLVHETDLSASYMLAFLQCIML